MVLRRDFLNGFALGTVGALAPRWALGLDDAALEKAPGYYPPALTGLRGSHEDKTAHAMRDGSFWKTAGAIQDTGETYDLVVVGGGLSGLAAAYFYREAAGPDARILVLDNHDDFGGHAKRNEFQEGGRTILGYGGSYSIDSPAPYSAVAQDLVKRLGVDVASWPRVVDRKLYGGRGLRPSVFFDAKTFGVDRLLSMPVYNREGEAGEAPEAAPDAWTSFLAGAPLSEPAKRDLHRIYTERVDYMPDLTSDQKKARLARMSYADFLTGPARAHRDLLPFFQTRPHSLYGVGIDAVPAQDAWGLGLPGFAGMNLDAGAGPGMNLDAIRHDGRAVLLPFPRRQRDARPPHGARARPPRHPRPLHGRHRDGAGGLLPSGRPFVPRAGAPQQHRGAGGPSAARPPTRGRRTSPTSGAAGCTRCGARAW